MASVAVMAAVRERLEDLWDRCPVVFDARTQPPADASPFLVVEYPAGGEEPVSFGAPEDNLYREVGAIRFVLHRPRRSEPEQWVAWVDDLRRMFRGKNLSDHIRTYGASPAALDDRDTNGNYWLLSTSVAYEADVFG